MQSPSPHQRQLKEYQVLRTLEAKLGLSPEANGGKGTLSDLTLEELVLLQRQVAAEIQTRMGM